MPTTARHSDLLSRLVEADVAFIVVGGMAAVLHGAPITTHDLDIVHQRTPENIDKLLQVLRSINAGQRGDPRRLPPDTAALSGGGHLTLQTDLGPLDVLGELQPGEGYAELIGRTVAFADSSLQIRVLELEVLIEQKTKSGRAKDRLVLAQLIATLNERNKRERS